MLIHLMVDLRELKRDKEMAKNFVAWLHRMGPSKERPMILMSVIQMDLSMTSWMALMSD